MVSLSQLLTACGICSGNAAVPVKVYKQADQPGVNSQWQLQELQGQNERQGEGVGVGRQATP